MTVVIDIGASSTRRALFVLLKGHEKKQVRQIIQLLSIYTAARAAITMLTTTGGSPTASIAIFVLHEPFGYLTVWYRNGDRGCQKCTSG
jgi:hypothetical protein